MNLQGSDEDNKRFPHFYIFPAIPVAVWTLYAVVQGTIVWQF